MRFVLTITTATAALRNAGDLADLLHLLADEVYDAALQNGGLTAGDVYNVLDAAGVQVGTFEGEVTMGDADDDRDYDEHDQFRDDVEADADVLASAGWGTDEDYGYFGDDDY